MKENKLRRKYKIDIGTVVTFIAGFMFFALTIIIAPAWIETIESQYSMDGIIIDVNSDEILVEDITGNIWAFEGKGYAVDDIVRVTFFNNHTDNTRLDDEIIEVIKINK